jgi:hypothetical protein
MKKTVIALALFGFLGGATIAHAEETIGEKATATGHDVKRAAKKGVNRTKEAFCAEGDVKCLKDKASNRVGEGVDATKDKASEVKNKVD